MPSEEQANVLAMEKIVAQHEGYTAEVIHINVFGRKRVDDFRLLKPGHEIELRMGRGGIRVYAFGKFMADVLEPAESNLPRLFKETIRRSPLTPISEAVIERMKTITTVAQ